MRQGGQSWQPFGEGKSEYKNFRQAHNRKFANSIQSDMQYIQCDSELLFLETLFLTQKALFLAKVFRKVRESR